MWKCDPSNIQNCLNCQYPDCINHNVTATDDETDELEREVQSDITRSKTKWKKNYEYYLRNRELCHERANKSRSTPRAKKLRRERDAMNKAINEERNKGITYGFVYDYVLLHHKTPSVKNISEELSFSENKVRLYLRQLTEERLIDYREEITIY